MHNNETIKIIRHKRYNLKNRKSIDFAFTTSFTSKLRLKIANQFFVFRHEIDFNRTIFQCFKTFNTNVNASRESTRNRQIYFVYLNASFAFFELNQMSILRASITIFWLNNDVFQYRDFDVIVWNNARIYKIVDIRRHEQISYDETYWKFWQLTFSTKKQ